MRAAERDLRVLVAGSFHQKQSGTPRNRVVVLGRSGELLSHDKFNPFSFLGNLEDIDCASPTITLAFHRRCIFTTLICKDLLEPGVDELLAQVGVDLLLAPSMSQKTEAFIPVASKLTSNAQAVVAIATFAEQDEQNHPAVGLATVPTLGESCYRVFRSQVEPPEFLLFEVGQSEQAPPWVAAWSGKRVD